MAPEASQSGVFAQFGFGILGNQTGTDGVLLIQFPRDYRLDGDGGQTQFVDVVAQYGIFFVFGLQSQKERTRPNPKLHRRWLCTRHRCVEHGGFGILPLVEPLTSVPVRKCFADSAS